MTHYDIIVIGAGSGGLNIAKLMNKAGFSTLIIDKTSESIGGNCLNQGCILSKALIHHAREVKIARKMNKFGLHVQGEVNLKEIMNSIKEKKEHIKFHENINYFRRLGMSVELGNAYFVNENTVRVDNKEFTGSKIVIATGSRPKQLIIPGSEKINLLSNENIFDLEKLPQNLVVIGAGTIGIELGQAFLNLGSDVTILEKTNKYLPNESDETQRMLHTKLHEEGMKIIFNATPLSFPSKNLLKYEKDGKDRLIEFDNVLVSIGRELQIDKLKIGNANIEYDHVNNRIKVNEYLQTTNKNVFVCGDVAGSHKFTHASELQAKTIVSNFFKPRFLWKKMNYDKFSWVTYTDPEIATFGLQEMELYNRKINYQKLEVSFRNDERAVIDEANFGKLTLYISKSEKILGGSMIAKNAGELFQELSLVMSSGLKLKSILKKIYPYPTATRINKHIVSKYYSTKLTDRAKNILQKLYNIKF